MDGVSIIVCCFNSERRLPETLKFLAKQHVANDLRIEIIIVDNNSTDKTSETARKAWSEFETLIELIVVHEPKPGLNYARLKGVEVARYECIIFCDDDNWLDPEYTQTSFTILSQNPHYAAVGGMSVAAFDPNCDVPLWFKTFMAGYAVGKQAQETSVVTERGFLWGSGLVFRKSLFKRIVNDNFPLLLSDRKGKLMSSGGDSEICLRFIILGYDLYYSEQMKFTHYIPSERLTVEYQENLYKGFEVSLTTLNKYYFFISNYCNKKMRALIKVKWILMYWFDLLKPREMPKSEFTKSMLSIYGGSKYVSADKDFRLMLSLFRKRI